MNLNDMDIYVGVLAGSFLVADLANQLTPMESFAPLSRAIPAGIFDNEGISRFLRNEFNQAGRTKDFRQLKHKLYSVAVDLDSGKAVTFGGPAGPVPARRGRRALLHGRRVEEDAQSLARARRWRGAGHRRESAGTLRRRCRQEPRQGKDGKAHRTRIAGGAIADFSHAYSLTHAGLEKYAAKYKNASIVLFEPGTDDPEMFFTNLFRYASLSGCARTPVSVRVATC